MIRAVLLTFALTAAAAAASGQAFAGSGGEVVTVDNGPGHDLVIVRGDGDRGGQLSGRREVLDYTDASGLPVRAYADYPVSREEVDARLREADRERQAALREGAQARAEGARARLEGERERAEALRDAARARDEASRERREAQREAEQARDEAAQARREAYAQNY